MYSFFGFLIYETRLAIACSYHEVHKEFSFRKRYILLGKTPIRTIRISTQIIDWPIKTAQHLSTSRLKILCLVGLISWLETCLKQMSHYLIYG